MQPHTFFDQRWYFAPVSGGVVSNLCCVDVLDSSQGPWLLMPSSDNVMVLTRNEALMLVVHFIGAYQAGLSVINHLGCFLSNVLNCGSLR